MAVPQQPVAPGTPSRGQQAEDALRRALWRAAAGPGHCYGVPPPLACLRRTPVSVARSASRGGLPTVLDEKLLKVTMTLYVVKPCPLK